MSIFNSILTHSQVKTSHSLYPTFKPDHNYFVKTGGNILFYIIGLVSLPAKLLLRQKFGYRYFTLQDYTLYMAMLLLGFWYGSLYLVAAPSVLLITGLNNVSWSYNWFLHFPILSIAFIIWISVKLLKKFRAERNRPLDKTPSHGYYPGESKLLVLANDNTKYDSKYIAQRIEPALCITSGILLLPLDFLLGFYFILMGICLKIEIWHEKHERKMSILDLTDSIIDSLYHQAMFEKFSACENQKLPVEKIYDEMTSVDKYKVHKSIKDELVNGDLPELSNTNLDPLNIEKLLKQLK